MMITESLNKYRIILASRSPRREQLLRELGLRFDVVIRDWPEKYPENLRGEEIALYLAREKADTFKKDIAGNEIVITADTIVWCNGRILDKPAGKGEAFEILKEISGNTHEVITGVCLLTTEKQVTFFSSTKVTFDFLSDDEINYYIDNYRPFDKAGAYGIQEWIGLAACSKIEGCYFNVIGLPVHKVYTELKRFISE